MHACGDEEKNHRLMEEPYEFFCDYVGSDPQFVSAKRLALADDAFTLDFRLYLHACVIFG